MYRLILTIPSDIKNDLIDKIVDCDLNTRVHEVILYYYYDYGIELSGKAFTQYRLLDDFEKYNISKLLRDDLEFRSHMCDICLRKTTKYIQYIEDIKPLKDNRVEVIYARR